MYDVDIRYANLIDYNNRTGQEHRQQDLDPVRVLCVQAERRKLEGGIYGEMHENARQIIQQFILLG